jgi:uncharacterized membrane protein YfcA
MLDIYSIVITIIIGTIAGLIAGFAGTTTADTILPGLLLFGLVPDFKTAAGTTLLAILPPLSIGAVIEYYRKGNVDVPLAIILMIVASLTTFLGARFSHMVSDALQKRVLAIYLLFVSGFLLYTSFDKAKQQ